MFLDLSATKFKDLISVICICRRFFRSLPIFQRFSQKQYSHVECPPHEFLSGSRYILCSVSEDGRWPMAMVGGWHVGNIHQHMANAALCIFVSIATKLLDIVLCRPEISIAVTQAEDMFAISHSQRGVFPSHPSQLQSYCEMLKSILFSGGT